MATTKDKMASLIILYLFDFTCIRAHEESLNNLSDSSDDMERESSRRSQSEKNWQYMGLPIDFSPPRRSNELQELKAYTGTKSSDITHDITQAVTTNEWTPTHEITTTSEVTTKPYPPLNYRYRRIYNPDEVASVKEYPFMAAVLVNGQLWCGGAIIGHDTVLTAAHCLQLQYNNRFFREYVKMLSIRVGSSNATSGGEVYRAQEIFFYPNYKPNTLEFNYAVLRLHKNISLERRDFKVEKIAYTQDKTVPTDSQITFLGWGSVLGMGGVGGQTLLQKVALPVYDFADCQEVYGRDLVTRTNFCAGFITLRKNVCNHDAGGPAIMDGILIGILSFSSKRCDQADKPAVFSSVGAISSWLENLGEKKLRLNKMEIKSPDPV